MEGPRKMYPPWFPLREAAGSFPHSLSTTKVGSPGIAGIAEIKPFCKAGGSPFFLRRSVWVAAKGKMNSHSSGGYFVFDKESSLGGAPKRLFKGKPQGTLLSKETNLGCSNSILEPNQQKHGGTRTGGSQSPRAGQAATC